MEIKNHILQDIKFLKSPNFNERPNNIEINLLVIHSISLPPRKYNTDHIEKFFMNELDCRLDNFYKEIDGLKVSSHVLIKRTGEIIQFVPFNQRAWHAGVSIPRSQSLPLLANSSSRFAFAISSGSPHGASSR